MSPTDDLVKAWPFSMELIGYSAPQGAQRLQVVVPLDSQECEQAFLVTYREDKTPYERVDVTHLIENAQDITALRFIAKVATRLAAEAFAAGKEKQRLAVLQALGL